MFQPRVLLSSYDEGCVGGDSLRLIRWPGDPEKAGTFFAHSVVLWAAEVANAFADIAPNRGEVIPPTLLLFTEAGFVSDDWASGASDGDGGLELSLSL